MAFCSKLSIFYINTLIFHKIKIALVYSYNFIMALHNLSSFFKRLKICMCESMFTLYVMHTKIKITWPSLNKSNKVSASGPNWSVCVFVNEAGCCCWLRCFSIDLNRSVCSAGVIFSPASSDSSSCSVLSRWRSEEVKQTSVMEKYTQSYLNCGF